MFGFIVAQDQARAKAIIEKSKQLQRQQQPAPISVNPRKGKLTSNKEKKKSALATPPSTPTSVSRSIKSNASSPKKMPKKQRSPTPPPSIPKFGVDPADIDMLQQSWSGELQPTDVFDIVGTRFANISEACGSSDYWERVVEEMQMSNIHIENVQSFIQFYSTSFTEALRLAMVDLQHLDASVEYMHSIARKHSELFQPSWSYYDALQISMLVSLMDSFADAFHPQLQQAWKKFMTTMMKSLDSAPLQPSTELTDAASIASSSEDSIFTRQDSRRTSSSALTHSSLAPTLTANTTATTPIPEHTKTLNPQPRAQIVSFYTRPASVKEKKSVSSLRSRRTSTGAVSSSARSITESTHSSHSATSSITTSESGKKMHNGKTIPAFIAADLEERIAAVELSASPSAVVAPGYSRVEAEKEAQQKRTKSKKAGKFFNTLLFPSGNLGPLMP